MEQYDYPAAVKADVYDWIIDNMNYVQEAIQTKEFDMDDLREWLNEELFISDSVTGNASGSYTFNAWDAEEYLCHNWDLIRECLQEYDMSTEYFREVSAESMDVSIRCYLLYAAIDEVLEDFEIEDYKLIKKHNED